MIYTDNTVKAMMLAYESHHGQFDKIGVPYIYHIMEVASHMETEDTTIVALLHDILEDTTVTKDKLLDLFDEYIVDAISVLTRCQGDDYIRYIYKIKLNPIATIVKIQDLKHNMNEYRVENANTKSTLLKRYEQALTILNT